MNAVHPARYYLDCIDKGICLYWRSLGKARNMEIHAGDIEYVLSTPRGGPERIYRVSLAPETAEQRIAEIGAGIRAGSLPNGMLITPASTPENLVALLVRHGFSIDTADPCMALDLCNLRKPSPTDEAIQVFTLTDDTRLRQWADILNVALCGSEIMRYEQLHDLYDLNYATFFMALYEDVPAAVSMTLREGDTATLEFVATLKEQRHKGLGRAVVGAALRHLRDAGIVTVTLRAEQDGIRLYQHMGFMEICKRTVAYL
jgi:GNAT superfamily N-acetyltransferase